MLMASKRFDASAQTWADLATCPSSYVSRALVAAGAVGTYIKRGQLMYRYHVLRIQPPEVGRCVY